jgi:hypothetical protein
MKNNSLFQQCLEILKRDDVKNDLKLLLNPLVEFLLFEIRPYAYIMLLILFMLIILSIANLLIILYYFRRSDNKI